MFQWQLNFKFFTHQHRQVLRRIRILELPLIIFQFHRVVSTRGNCFCPLLICCCCESWLLVRQCCKVVRVVFSWRATMLNILKIFYNLHAEHKTKIIFAFDSMEWFSDRCSWQFIISYVSFKTQFWFICHFNCSLFTRHKFSISIF